VKLLAIEKNISLYEKYAEQRDKLGLTDYKVAQIAGISRGIISEWKHGRCKPNAENRMRIAKAIKKNISFLM
jgi:transcriptional regulator with XRE-family HTH domain